MIDSSGQPNNRRPPTPRRWHPWVGFAEGWVGFAPHRGQLGEFDLVGYHEPTWAMRRAIAEALRSQDPRAVAHI